jgi:hypothetical protein
LFSFEIDPHKVLGVTAEASLSELREAYRQKAKRYHPDAGGEDWTFRILVQAYEMLSSARVARASHAEAPTRSRPAQPTRPAPKRSDEYARQGIHDALVPPFRLVALELLCVRYLWEDAEYLWLTQRVPDEDRFLSCSLNLTWPDGGRPLEAGSDNPGAIVAILREVFDHMIITSRVATSRSRDDDSRFVGWLSYSNFDRAWKAVNSLHELLLARGLGLRQWSRDLFIPRSWR